MSNVRNQIVLITGSSSGFGRLTAEQLASAGYTVIATMRGVDGKNAAAAQALREATKDAQGSLEIVELDVCSDASVDAAVSDILARHGRIDVVVNNAGTGGIGMSDMFTVEQAKAQFEVNVFGVMRVNRAVLPSMLKRGRGLLIHVSSGLGRVIFPAMSIYISTKWALEALAETMRYELAPTGVDSVILQPGAFPTGFGASAQSPADADRAANYGAAAQVMQNLGAAMEQMLTGPNAADPKLVAYAIQKLIETPTGARPLRTPVDPNTGHVVETINNFVGQVQSQLMQGMGMGPLLQVTPKQD